MSLRLHSSGSCFFEEVAEGVLVDLEESLEGGSELAVHIALPLGTAFDPHCLLGAIGGYAHVADHRMVHLNELSRSRLLLTLLDPLLSPF
jgi:hypothetical protein